MKTKSKKLYQVRHTPDGLVFGKTIGHKFRLVPRTAAARICKRLRRVGVDAYISPVYVNLTPEQTAYLKRRYD